MSAARRPSRRRGRLLPVGGVQQPVAVAGVRCCSWGGVTGHPAACRPAGRGLPGAGRVRPAAAGRRAARGQRRVAGRDELDEAAWRVFAPLVAARPVTRLSADGGRSCPRARGLAAGRPAAPAAVATFDTAGRAPNVVFDLDVSKAARAGGCRRRTAGRPALARYGAGRGLVLGRRPAGRCPAWLLFDGSRATGRLAR